MKHEEDKPEIACFNCIRPDYYCDHVECNDAPIELIESCEDDFSLPHKCGMYLPYVVEKCKFCESPINDFKYKHKYWFDAGECMHPICKNCHDSVPEETLKESIYCSC